MSAQKTPEPARAGPAAPTSSGRKAWKKKTPVEVVLEQEQKLREEVTEMEEELKQKRLQLGKFEEFRKIVETPKRN